MRVAIISDTHFPGRGSELPPACRDRIRDADLLIHAGDLCDMPTLQMLRALGPPVIAVHGNADDAQVRAALAATATVELSGLELAVVHNGGAEAGRVERLRRRFPTAQGVIFGHSHIALHASAPDGFFVLNPGSAADRRRRPHHTMAEVTVAPGAAPTIAFFAIDEPPGPLDPMLVRTVG